MNSFNFHDRHFVTVTSFSDLTDTDFQGTVNSHCWKRSLKGDFKEIVSKLQLEEDITVVSPDDLSKLSLSENGEIAREIILNDLQLLTDFGAAPTLNLLKNYERDGEFDFISTDVYSFHVDRSPVLTDTFLCTYYGASSDILPNDQAVQKILIPEVREKLIELHEGSDDDFETFLEENFFDLHYEPKEDSQPINLGQGNLWRLAVDHPEQKVLPCIHRAPVENDGEYRLLLIC
ncbi:hypothetical protein [Chryseobacterium sp. Leaf394]|uniref:hypothetical protein n=1 Tax=Chryseobacterium sp. Leaf394 TaxID=1736361 RepID=UPI0006FD0404|nr:hypothetical protein [Chryseobacterium sp. Leaf394]KQS92997.1 hypothetical protein ASG21_11345 [Chryseobacterium sp. Leaf394]